MSGSGLNIPQISNNLLPIFSRHMSNFPVLPCGEVRGWGLIQTKDLFINENYRFFGKPQGKRSMQ